MKKQDEGLDILSLSVQRLGQNALGIAEELGQQNKMLDSMETDLDEAGEELDSVTRKTKEFIKQAGGLSNFVIILSLCLVVVVLLFLVLYT
jgi:SYP6 family syntaxin